MRFPVDGCSADDPSEFEPDASWDDIFRVIDRRIAEAKDKLKTATWNQNNEEWRSGRRPGEADEADQYGGANGKNGAREEQQQTEGGGGRNLLWPWDNPFQFSLKELKKEMGQMFQDRLEGGGAEALSPPGGPLARPVRIPKAFIH